jgi:hypothetical protein
MQFGEYNLNAAEASLRLDVHWDSTSLIGDFNAAIFMKGHFNPRAMPGKSLINRVINDFPEAMHESSAVGRTDVHAGALANGL